MQGSDVVEGTRSGSGRLRVLVVDDEPSVGHTFRAAVDALRYDVDFATGSEALERAQTRPYAIVAISLRLRGVDGCAVIDAIGAVCPETAFIVLMTPQGAMAGQPSSLVPGQLRANAAVSCMIGKPWEDSELSTKLELARRLHGQRRLRQQRECSPGATSVMIVEDSPTDSLMLRRCLEQSGNVHIVCVGTLRAAIEALHSSEVDTIITDLSLPDARGVDTVFRLRSAKPEAAIVVCTSIDDEPLTLQLIQLGAHECLVKGNFDAHSVARSLAVARERKAFERRLVHLAYRDPLTGAANRAGWQLHADAALERAARRGDRLVVALIDLDGFKQTNDRFGHDVGDALLQELVARLQRHVREYDVLARIGGDEFALLLTDIGPELEVAQVGERLQRELAAPVTVGGEEHQGIPASIGIAVFPDSGDSLPALIKSADAAMYQAKVQDQRKWVVAKS
jgi:two-component system cell cycle response regulator